MRTALILLAAVLAAPAAALDLALPGGTERARDETPAGSVRLPREPWREGLLYPGTDGAIRRVAYSVSNPARTTLQLLAPIGDRLAKAGYAQVFACADAACGGFDFRFQLDLLEAPAMYVDLGNYRYALWERDGDDPHSVALVASSSATAGFLHVTTVSAPVIPEPPAAVEPAPDDPQAQTGLIAELLDTGHSVLADLDFAVGSATLGAGPYDSLAVLADWLAATPGARIVLVGHTDSLGSLEANEALSRDRATSVLTRLTRDLGASTVQVQAEGAGALSPLASNLTEEGRALNRRVEVILLSLE